MLIKMSADDLMWFTEQASLPAGMSKQQFKIFTVYLWTVDFSLSFPSCMKMSSLINGTTRAEDLSQL